MDSYEARQILTTILKDTGYEIDNVPLYLMLLPTDEMLCVTCLEDSLTITYVLASKMGTHCGRAHATNQVTCVCKPCPMTFRANGTMAKHAAKMHAPAPRGRGDPNEI